VILGIQTGGNTDVKLHAIVAIQLDVLLALRIGFIVPNAIVSLKVRLAW
jgi:hypothetical protein